MMTITESTQIVAFNKRLMVFLPGSVSFIIRP
jgi:hypothetical protein